jgi:hypothetical protein
VGLLLWPVVLEMAPAAPHAASHPSLSNTSFVTFANPSFVIQASPSFKVGANLPFVTGANNFPP